MDFLLAFEMFGAAMEGSHLLDLVGNAATVTATEPMRVLAWRHKDLRQFLNKHLTVRFAFRAIMGENLAKKLKERG
jgi:hypothetical protein